MTKGTLLLNLGTPDNPDTKSVRRYLREFLSDPRVVDINPVARAVLLNLIILPFRSPKSAEAYREIWTEQGSPLLVNSIKLMQKLEVGPVALGMRYGNPSIESAISNLFGQGVTDITILPLFPQHASSSSGSAIEKAVDIITQKWNIPNVRVISEFYEDAGFIQASSDIIKETVADHNIDHYIFSYHGLPVRHINKSGCKGCEGACPEEGLSVCYRFQSYRTTRLLADKLGLSRKDYTVAFQSRLGRTPWIRPYLDDVLEDCAKAGHKNIAIACPSFVADCLETLEEIGIRAREDWHKLSGGGDLHLVPCLNDDDRWVKAVSKIIKDA
ncbi:MAG: ferrochelatase [Alphaproteobacteria bacterium]